MLSLICVAMLTTTNKIVVENIPRTVVNENYQLNSDDSYFKQCLKSVDCRMLKEALYWEARGESDKGVIAVAYVILNRTNHKNWWPSTIKGVVTQPYQFSYRHDGSMDKGFTEKRQYVRVATIAAKVIDGIIPSPVAGSTYYHHKSISPYWAKVKRKVAQIGNHVFRQ